MTQEKTSKQYWDGVWQYSELPAALDPSNEGLNFTFDRSLDNFFQKFLQQKEGEPLSLIELGCGQSQFLPYFAKTYSFKVSGIDYSERGVKSCKQILENSGIEDSTIVLGDVFSPPPSMLNAYDIVFSFGLIEHFQDTAGTVEKLSGFLKPGGIIITFIPNLSGYLGLMQKVLSKQIYDIHVVMNKEDVQNAHESAKLKTIICSYFMFINNNILNTSLPSEHIMNIIFRRLMSWSTKCFWLLEKISKINLPANKITSPYIVYIGQKSV